MLATLLVLGAIGQIPDTVVTFGPIATPTISGNGILAFERDGDIWTVPVETSSGTFELMGAPINRTKHPARDRNPAWSPAGDRLVFSSDRVGGSFDLWEIEIDGSATPRRLTGTLEDDTEPTVGADGQIVYVRGGAEQSDLWLMSASGTNERLTSREGREVSPQMHPDNRGLVYVSVDDRGRSLMWLELGTGESRSLVDDVQVESPVWSPDGERLVFATRTGTIGVWVSPRDGRFRNLVAERAAAGAWSPDGRFLLLAELPRPGPRYNGDPNRVPDRNVDRWQGTGETVFALEMPPAALPASTAVPVSTRTPRRERYATRFDEFWQRMTQLYFRTANTAWASLRESHRTLAIEAPNDSVFDAVIHDVLKTRPTLRREAAGRAAVSSAHPLATAAGIEILNAGGNVVDAAVAVSFALGVVEPDASGIGGYGEMVVATADTPSPVVIEFLTRVPEQASLDNAALAGDRLPSDGPVLANVPGTVAGMYTAWQRYGSGQVTWARLLEPAIRLAANGFELDDAFPTTLTLERDRFLRYPSSQALFFPDGMPLQAGDTLRNPDLAWTLGQIAERGADGFYRGDVAQRMVEDLRGKGNAITQTDLSRYFAALREPVIGTYRGHTIYSGAPAVSGGVSLVGKLHHLDNAAGITLYRDDARSLHAMIEAWKLMPSTSGRVADPGLWPVDYEPILDRDSARARWERCFDERSSTGDDELRRVRGSIACMEEERVVSMTDDVFSCTVVTPDCRSTGTTAFAVADADGNMVAVTQTLGTWGGNFYVTPGLGFLYNDKLRSYSSNPNAYNARIPFARNSTSIAPTLVFRGTGDNQTPLLALGAAGNAWITSAVYQVLSGIVDGNLGPQRALELPRFLVGVDRSRSDTREVVIQTEDGFAPEAIRQLEAMGHVFQPISLRGELRMGYGAAVLLDGNRVRAGADPRRSGAAGAIN